MADIKTRDAVKGTIKTIDKADVYKRQIKQMLKAEILFNDIIITPETGTPQGGFYPHFLQMLY